LIKDIGIKAELKGCKDVVYPIIFYPFYYTPISDDFNQDSDG
jgi:hypothetical protein